MLADPLEVPAPTLITGRRSIVGWPFGTALGSEDTMAFSVLTGVRSLSEPSALLLNALW